MTVLPCSAKTRWTAVLLVVCLSTTMSAQIFRRPPESALAALAERARKRDKEAAAQEKQWLKRRQEAGARAMQAYKKGKADLSDEYRQVSEVYEQARGVTGNERDFLRELIFAQQHPANQPLPNAMALMDWVMPLPVPYSAGRFPPEVEALNRLEQARRQGLAGESLAVAEAAVEAHRQRALALGFLRNSLNDYLRVGGVATVEQRYERRLEAQARERAAWAARNANAEADLALGGAIVLGILSLGVLAAGLNSLTPEGRAAAQSQLDTANRIVAATCAPPNIYMPPTPTVPARCIPR